MSSVPYVRGSPAHPGLRHRRPCGAGALKSLDSPTHCCSNSRTAGTQATSDAFARAAKVILFASANPQTHGRSSRTPARSKISATFWESSGDAGAGRNSIVSSASRRGRTPPSAANSSIACLTFSFMRPISETTVSRLACVRGAANLSSLVPLTIGMTLLMCRRLEALRVPLMSKARDQTPRFLGVLAPMDWQISAG